MDILIKKLPLVWEIVRNALNTRNVLTPDRLATYGVMVSQLNKFRKGRISIIYILRQRKPKE